MKALFLFLVPLLAGLACSAAQLTITVTHGLDAARPAETITVPWADLARALPGVLLQHLAVKDAAGHSLPYQVTNLAPVNPPSSDSPPTR